MTNDLEHAALIAEIYKCASGGQDQMDTCREYSVKINALIDGAVAAELDRQATVQWDASTMIEPAQKVLSEAGEEAGAALLDVSIRTMREVSARLKRRAAEVRGVTPEELAARGILMLPEGAVFTRGEALPPAEAAPSRDEPPKKEGPDDPPTVE